jgi:CHAD domain-containing protein
MASPKWKIKGIGGKKSFRKSAQIILNERIGNLNKAIKLYLKNLSAENLHSVRISIRRLRYCMELFYNLFDKKVFLSLYDMIEKLQDKTGEVRDIFILKQNLILFGREDQISIPETMKSRIEEKERTLSVDLKNELYNYVYSAELKHIIKLIKKKEIL